MYILIITYWHQIESLAKISMQLVLRWIQSWCWNNKSGLNHHHHVQKRKYELGIIGARPFYVPVEVNLSM